MQIVGILGLLFVLGIYGFAIAIVALIISTAIVVRKNTRMQTQLQQQMKDLLWEIKALLQEIADGDGEETDDVV